VSQCIVSLWSQLTTSSDRVEVEWKYILKLHPDESQRPKPSPNAKPLPEHLKESDASLDITNRTDGVPDMGDPFQDPHSEQKWAEWHTAPQVTRRSAKIDFSKENRLWYYLGKPSTEARPQYTENPAKPRNNPKSNFLDTVKPPPPPVPTFAQRSYPASYPIKPAPIAMPPRTPYQHQSQPSSKPYSYKPKENYMTTWKSPVYNPDTRKNPNSPVAHQPNVSYDHRPPSQPYGQAYQGYHNHRPPSQAYGEQQQQPQPQPPQQYQYHSYVPPQARSSSNWQTQPGTSGQMPNGTGRYAQPIQPYSSQPNSRSPPPLPPYPYSQGSGQSTKPDYSPSPYGTVGQAPSGRASISSMMSSPIGPPKPPMYANAPSIPVVSAAQNPTEYLTYVMQYPYLKNAYLRRAKTYVSPYSNYPGGGFTESWMPKVSNPSTPTAIAPRPVGPAPIQPYYHGQNHPATGLPASKPTAQFQSSDAFQRDMARTTHPAEAPKWEQMLKQLATSTGPTALPTVTADPPQMMQPRYPPPTSRSGASYDLPRSMQPAPSHTPPLLQPRDLRRPTPSPISDDGKGVVAVPTEQAISSLPPLQVVPQGHPGAETWRYS